MDPSNWDAAFTLHHAYALLGRYDDVEHQRRVLGEAQAPGIIAVRAYLALVRGDQSAWEQVLYELRDIRILLPGYLVIANLPEHPDRVREFIHVLHLPESRSAEQRAGGHIALAIYAAARGRWSEAKTELTVAERLYPVAAFEFGAILSMAPFLEVPREDLVSVRSKLAQWDPETAGVREDLPYPQGEGFPYPPGLRPVLRPYLLGLLSSRLGERATALQYASELERLPAPKLMPSMPQDLAGSVRAHVALDEGREEDALAFLEQARMDTHVNVWFHYAPEVLTMLSHERFLRAELLHRLRHDDKALGWYTPEYQFGGPSFAFAHLRVAEIHEKQGDVKKAIEHYDLFTRFWKDCDPELRPVLEDAKTRLSLLQAKGT